VKKTRLLEKMAKTNQKAPKTAKKTPKKSAAATMATRSATATKSKSAKDENPQMNTLTTATSKSGGPKLSIVTGERLVRSSDMASKSTKPKMGSQSLEVQQLKLHSLMASFTNILEVVREMRGLILGLADRVGKV
jgi:hypothetical protein